MNANRKMSKAEMLRQPKKETKGGKRKQRMFLRKALARKLKVPASSLKGKTFEELADLLDKEDLKDVLATLDKAKSLLGDDEEDYDDDEVDEDKLKRDVGGVMSGMLDIVEQAEEPPFQPDFEEEEKVNVAQQKKKIRKKVEEASDLPEDVANIIAGMSLGSRPKQEGKYDDEDDLDQAEVWQYPALGVPRNANLEVPNSSLNDNMIVSANARSAFQPNPLVPVRQRYEPARREVLEDNENMRIDPRPDVIPRQDILEQVRILEGPEGQMPHGEPHRLPNPVVVNDPRLAQNNMGSMEQNVMMNRNMMDRREMTSNVW
jgi:hypothetical protein